MLRWCHILLVLLVLTVDSHISSATKEDYNEPRETAESKTRDKNAKNTEKSRGALGQGFNIHKMDLLTKELQATGAKIFENLDYDKCTRTDKSGTTSKDDTFYSDTESLYSSISSNSKIDASVKGPYTLGASVSAVTNNIVSGNTEVSGLSLNLKAQSISHALSKDCINNNKLSKELIKDFEKLDKKIKNPWKSQSWRKYEVNTNC